MKTKTPGALLCTAATLLAFSFAALAAPPPQTPEEKAAAEKAHAESMAAAEKIRAVR